MEDALRSGKLEVLLVSARDERVDVLGCHECALNAAYHSFGMN